MVKRGPTGQASVGISPANGYFGPVTSAVTPSAPAAPATPPAAQAPKVEPPKSPAPRKLRRIHTDILPVDIEELEALM